MLSACLIVAATAGPVAAARPAFNSSTLIQAEPHPGSLVNAERVKHGLLALEFDPDVMAIATRRAETPAATDLLSHTNPDGSRVFDAIVEAGIPWFGAGEVIGWNSHQSVTDSAAQVVAVWLESPGHAAVLLSADFNYVGFGVAVSPTTGYHYFAGVFLKRTDRTGAWVKGGTTPVVSLDATRSRITVRWTGGDPILQVLTAGVRDYEVQRRVVGGAWRALGLRTGTSVTETLPRARNASACPNLRVPDPGPRQGRQHRRLDPGHGHGPMRVTA